MNSSAFLHVYDLLNFADMQKTVLRMSYGLVLFSMIVLLIQINILHSMHYAWGVLHQGSLKPVSVLLGIIS